MGNNLEEDFDEQPADTSQLNVVRQALISPKVEEKEEWLRTAIFHTQVNRGERYVILLLMEEVARMQSPKLWQTTSITCRETPSSLQGCVGK